MGYSPPLLLQAFLFISVTASAQISAVDDLQHTVSIPVPARRIVSLAPSITETLFAIGAGEQVIGVTDYCDHPPEARRAQRVGGMTNPSIEAIAALKPDLVLLSMEGNVRADYDRLLQLGTVLFVTNPRSLDGIYKSIGDLGLLAGRDSEAARLVQSMKRGEDSLKDAATVARRVLVFVSLRPIVAVGNGTFVAELLALAGGVNAAGSGASHYPALSREAVLMENPEVLIFLSDVVAEKNEMLRLYPEWHTLSAFRAGRVFSVDADIVSRPGPRAIDGALALRKIIHQP